MPKKRGQNFYCLRSVTFTPEERTKSDTEDDGRTMFGYAAVFDAETEINSWEGAFTERIAQGAFKKSLREKTPVMQFDHGHDYRTGTVPIGAYTDIHEDNKGLYVEGRLFENDLVEPIRQAIEGKALDGMSFRFQVVRDEWRDGDGKKIKPDELWELLWSPGERGPLQRTIKEVKLAEAGPVVFPAYGQTSVGVRSETPDDLADLPEDERRQMVVDSYRSRMPVEDTQGADATDTSDKDAVVDVTPEPADAVRSNTSEGQKKERVVPARRRTVKRTIPVRSQRKDTPMLTLEEMRARLDEIAERMNVIADEYRDEDSGELRAEFSTDHETEWDALQSESDTLTAKVAKAEKRQVDLKRQAITKPKAVITGGAPALIAVKDDEDLHDVEKLRFQSRSQEEFVDAMRDNAKRIAEKITPPGVGRSKLDVARASVIDLIDGYDSKAGDLARRLMVTQNPVYRKAFGKVVLALSTDGLNAEERAALVVGVDAQGGYMVPAELDPTIIHTDSIPVNPIRQLSRVVSISGSKWQGITMDGVSVSRAAESEEAAETDPDLTRPEATPTRVQGFIRFSMELEQDWPAVEREMREALARAKDREEITSFTTGLGTGLNPQGLLVGATTPLNVDISDGGLKASHIYAAETALAPEFRSNASWLANKAFYNTVRQFPAEDGHDLWERIGAGQPAELLGYPTYEASNMTTDMTTLAGKLAVYGDLYQAYLIVDRIGMQVELIPHIIGANRRPTGERGIYVAWRNTAKVIRPEAVRVFTLVA